MSTTEMRKGRFIRPESSAEAPLTAWNQMGRKYMADKKAAPALKLKLDSAHTDRFLMMRGGRVARPCWRHCTTTKAAISTPKSTRRAMTRPSDHGYLVPPHCRARSRQMTAGMKKKVPTGANCQMRWLQGASDLVACWSRRGSGKKKAMTSSVTAPMGRLM